jgi:hypothetical protein
VSFGWERIEYESWSGNLEKGIGAVRETKLKATLNSQNKHFTIESNNLPRLGIFKSI